MKQKHRSKAPARPKVGLLAQLLTKLSLVTDHPIVAILGFVITALSFLWLTWDVSVDADRFGIIDNPLSERFVIANRGHIPIWQISADCPVVDAQFEGGSRFADNSIHFAYGTKTLWNGDSVSVDCDRPFSIAGLKLKSDIAGKLTWSYRIWFIPHTFTREVTFRAFRGPSGTSYWRKED